jgi:seryl-tRNA synthetase
MLSVKILRENGDALRGDLESRGQPERVTEVDEAVLLDKLTRELGVKVDALRKRRNEASREVNEAKKAGRDAAALLKEAAALPAEIERLEEETVGAQQALNALLARLPNLLHESVPRAKGEEGNVVVRKHGVCKSGGESHVDLLARRGLIDLERAAKIAGARTYFLKGKLALVDLALQRFALEFLAKKGFTPVAPPNFLNRSFYEGVTDLGDFENVMYLLGEEQFLIATSEHPLVAMHANEVLEGLPLKYAGVSPCYRREAGAHGKDQKGIFRVHQFNKVEQVVFCSADDSWKMHEELLANAEEFTRLLELPYRVVNVCSGEIGSVAAKKYDIEAWMPVQGAYREIISCSNCTDCQSNALNIRTGKYGGAKASVHTLNSTLMADTRTLVALVENHQTTDGAVRLPRALAEYCGFNEF